MEVPSPLLKSLTRKFFRYMAPSVAPNVKNDIDRKSLRSIFFIAVVVLFFETASVIPFLLANLNRMDHHDLVSLCCVCFCIVLCGAALFFSRRMSRNADLRHSSFFIFKITFFVLFTVWAIFVDIRHYKIGDQMLSFFVVNLIMICFVIFRPWLGTLLVSASYAGLYLSAYSIDKAAGIQPLNFIMLAVASVACNAIRCHAQINSSSQTIRLKEANAALKAASRRDGLTRLLNRLALEDDAEKLTGRKMTVFMVDINYFKEINDRYGHAAGDAILRQASEELLHLYPGAHYYRYGGDEFLVLTYKMPEENYGSDTYDFTVPKYKAKILLSIGNAQGCPASYDELFALISEADKALYITKQRTHSVEFGGHERRKSRGVNH